LFLHKIFLIIIACLLFSVISWGDQYTKLWQEGRLEQAINALQKVSDQTPENYTLKKRYQAMTVQKKSLDDLIAKSMQAIHRGEYQKAKNILEKAALINSNYPFYQKALKQLVQKETEIFNPSFTVPASWLKPKIPDFKGVENFVNTGAITTAYNLIKQLYGKLTVEQEELLKKQFAQYYAYPCDEVIKYFKSMIPVLYKAVALKTKLSIEMERYGLAAADASNSVRFKNEKMARIASNHLLQRRKNILAIQQQLAEINMHMNTIGTLPNALEIKKKREKAFEYLTKLAANEMGKIDETVAADSSLNGIWEIRDTDIVKETIISRKETIESKRINSFAIAQKESRNISYKNNQRLFMEPLDADKIYFKEMADLGSGYHFFFYANYRKTDGWNEYGFHIMQKTGKSTYTMYSEDDDENLPWKFILTIKNDTLICTKNQFIQTDNSLISSYEYLFHHIDHSPNLPAIKFFAGMEWNFIERTAKKWLDDYKKLNQKERNINFSLIKDEDESILLDQVQFNYNKNKYNQRVAASNGLFPQNIKNNNYLWKLTKTTVETHPLPLMGSGAFHVKTTYSIKEGWLKIWKEEIVDVSGPPQIRKTLLATYTWSVPAKIYKTDQVWNANPGGGGLANASWDLVLPTMKSSGVGIYFINSALIDFKKQQNKTMESGGIEMSSENLGSTGGRVELILKVKDRIGATVRFDFSALPKNGNMASDKNTDKVEIFVANKEDFYNLQIEELTEDISRYKEMMGKATTKDQKKQFSLMIMGKEADLQQQKDLLSAVKTGQFRHTKTKWDTYNAKITESRFIEESQKYQKKIRGAEYRIEMIKKIGEMSKKMISQDDLGVRDWAERQKKSALASGDDKKLANIYAALQKKYRRNLEQGQVETGMEIATMDDYLEAAEYVKDKADTAFMIASTIQSGGTMYLYAAYSGLTNGISEGIRSGVRHAIRNLNMVTMTVGSAYDGYNVVDPKTGKKAGLKGAATNVGITLAILGTCHVAIKGVVKASTVAQKAYSKYAFEAALTAQEREMSITMVRQYETKLQKIEKLIRRGETTAAREEAAVMEKETEKLMANPHAKNYLKYNGSESTRQMYLQYENRVKTKVETRFKKMMEERGWEEFELKEFRNAASGNSVGMDWDHGLVEENLKTMTINGKEVKVIMKHGKPMTIQQFQKEGEKLFRQAYHDVTGYSAEGSFATFTTSANAEAFKDVSILKNPAMADKDLAGQTAWTVKYKADHMLGKHSMGFITKAGKYGEACRGMAKEIRTKLIPNLLQTKNIKHYRQNFAFFEKLEKVLQDFGENKISIVEADRSVRNLTGKSLDELPKFISSSLRKAIKMK